MEVLNPNYHLTSFLTDLRRVRQNILMLDYDGTIAPFQINRMAAYPYPEVTDLLEILINKPRTKIVIITGRKISDLCKLFDLANRVEVWGSHGLERLTVDGKYEVLNFDKYQIAGLEKASMLIEELGFMHQCEAKPGALALHWRGLDLSTKAYINKHIYPALKKIADEFNLVLLDFDAGIELRCGYRNKDYAVNQILSELKQETATAYLGDDLTDEYAFKAIKRRGLAVRVAEKQRMTSADIYLAPPRELVRFLNHWIAAISSA